MSKALDILKELHNKDVFILDDLGLDHVDIYEAIAELEAQKANSCENCSKSKKCQILHKFYLFS